jgi:Flp pilus assembly protein TadD/ketosteroid isomerase-like protein
MLNFRDLPCCRSLVTVACVGLFALAPQAAGADSLQDAQRHLGQGQHAQALDQVDKYLSGKPKDAQGRFLKGLILTEMGKTSDAVVIFTRLTEDYPELPEPYNNLAVIYAQEKQYDKAKQALEMAIRTHPSYATAHENLGDIYARLASQAYDKALQLDKSNASAQSKLSMIRDLMGTAARPGAKPAAKPAAEVKATGTKPITVAVATPPATATATAKPTEPKPAEPKPVDPKPAGNVDSEVNRALEAWAAAWSKKDVKGYLAAYASDFQAPGGESRSAWEGERKKRIAKPGPIQVSFENLRVATEGADRATAKFRQHYKSGKLKTSANKIILLVKRDGKWQIREEKIGR